MLEEDVPCEPGTWSCPGLDSHPILCAREGNHLHRDILHSRLFRILSKAPDAASMETRISFINGLNYNLSCETWPEVNRINGCIVLLLELLPDSMAGSASNLLYPNVGGTGADRDAVIPSSYPRVQDCDTCRLRYVNAVGVGTGLQGRDLHALEFHITAPVDNDVEHLTFHRAQPTHENVVRIAELQTLQCEDNQT